MKSLLTMVLMSAALLACGGTHPATRSVAPATISPLPPTPALALGVPDAPELALADTSETCAEPSNSGSLPGSEAKATAPPAIETDGPPTGDVAAERAPDGVDCAHKPRRNCCRARTPACLACVDDAMRERERWNAFCGPAGVKPLPLP